MTASIARHDSKKASTSVNINCKLHSYNNIAEADCDQTTNYSLRYAEENSVIEGHFEYLNVNGEQENIFTPYYTEGTLKVNNIKINNTTQDGLNDLSVTNEKIKFINHNLLKLQETNKVKSYMELESNDKECENTDEEIYLHNDIEYFSDKCNEERLERIINVTPSHSPVELCNKDKENKMVTFGEDRYSQQTPLMFSRCSSLGSLSGCEQQSLHDDRSSIVSDFSRRASEVVSPSELLDSAAQISLGTQQKETKRVRKKIQHQQEKIQSSEIFPVHQEISKHSIFEDELSVFKEESTPVKFQSVTASSLSSLTIDDDDDVDIHSFGNIKNKANLIKTLKTSVTNEQCISDEDRVKKMSNEVFEENSYFSIDEEKILDEYIRKGIAKVTRQNIDDVSSFNLPDNKAYDSNISESEKTCQSDYKSNNSLELFDENSDLTAEEEKLLDECIRRGIAKVTHQNINDVTSISLRSNFAKISPVKCDKKDKEKKQLQHEEIQKRTTICQTEL